ncbi:hypothetical protein NIES4074_12340 [Cylindrospermum sp. NIES-4074]|nr:hypothetical protein NIES4074_12340 [Cylindrospermum sp. NIES-4074]
MPKLMLWQNIQAATAATLGVAILAAVGTAPATAANVKTFTISGTFFTGEPNPVYENINPNFGLERGLLARGGSFSGTFTADADRPFNPNDILGGVFEDWNVNVVSPNGEPVRRFYQPFPGGLDFSNLSYPSQEGISFSSDYYSFFRLYKLPQYIGSIPVYGVFQYSNTRYVSIDTYVSSFQISEPYKPLGENTVFGVQKVPEPLSLAGTGLAGAMGLWMKRKQKASQSV